MFIVMACIGVALCGRNKVHTNQKTHNRVHGSHRQRKRIFVNRRLATIDNMNKLNRFKKEVKVNMTILKKSQEYLDN